jgi:hypothetical protein
LIGLSSIFLLKNFPLCGWTSAKELEHKGFQFGGVLTGISLDISNEIPPKPVAAQNLTIKIVQSETDVLQFTELAGNAFAMNTKAVQQWVALNVAVMNKGEQIHFMA